MVEKSKKGFLSLIRNPEHPHASVIELSNSTGEHPEIVIAYRGLVTQGKLLFLGQSCAEHHIVSLPCSGNQQTRESLEEETAQPGEKGIREYALKGTGIGHLRVLAQKIVKVRCSAPPVTKDENRRMLKFGF